jgi:hypothetical protein
VCEDERSYFALALALDVGVGVGATVGVRAEQSENRQREREVELETVCRATAIDEEESSVEYPCPTSFHMSSMTT